MTKATKLGYVQGPTMDMSATDYMVDRSVDLLALRAERKAAGEHRAFWHVGAFPARMLSGAPLPLP